MAGRDPSNSLCLPPCHQGHSPLWLHRKVSQVSGKKALTPLSEHRKIRGHTDIVFQGQFTLNVKGEENVVTG